jgi:hypothetical protein
MPDFRTVAWMSITAKELAVTTALQSRTSDDDLLTWDHWMGFRRRPRAGTANARDASFLLTFEACPSVGVFAIAETELATNPK